MDFLLILISLIIFRFGLGFDHRCGSPPVPENGRVTFSLLADGVKTALYECDPDFILIGSDRATCQQFSTNRNSSSSWSHEPPVCAFNVARYKPAIQSSTFFDSFAYYHANYSTDGITDGSCSSTLNDSAESWLQVDLLNTYKIYAIELKFAPGLPGISETFHNLYLYTSKYDDDFREDNKNITLCYHHDGSLELSRLHTFICGKDTYGRFVRVKTVNNALSLCEIGVLSIETASRWQCPSINGMQLWNVFNGLCFYGSETAATWTEAKRKCAYIGGSLFSDPNGELRKFILSQMINNPQRSSQFYWIGVSNKDNAWRWTNGQEVIVNFWSDKRAMDVGQTSPDHAAVMAEMYRWNWLPSLQAVWYNWICQIPVSYCSHPGIMAEGGLSSDARSTGSTISYFCNSGYTLKGEPTRTCHKDGVWRPEFNATCAASPIDCTFPETVAGTKTIFLNGTTSIRSMVEYECERGKVLIGSKRRICMENGTWSGEAAHCEELDCGPPPPIEFGHVILKDGNNSTLLGAVAEYVCDDGFAISSNEYSATTRFCNASGFWDPDSIPVCYDIRSVPAALAPTGLFESRETSFIVGFISAIILLSIVLGIFILVWKRKKSHRNSLSSTYSTASQNSVTVSGNFHDLLYAFPNACANSAANGSGGSSSKQQSEFYAVSSESSISPYFISVVETAKLSAASDAEQKSAKPVENQQRNLLSVRKSLNNIGNLSSTIGALPNRMTNVNSIAAAIASDIKKVISATLRKAELQQKPSGTSATKFEDQKTISYGLNSSATADFSATKTSASPTPSELFSFDDDDDDEEPMPNNIDNKLSTVSTVMTSNDTFGTYPENHVTDWAYPENHVTAGACSENHAIVGVYSENHAATATTGVYPEGQNRAIEDNIYDVPCVIDDPVSSRDHANVKNATAGIIEISHTYC